MPDLSAAERIAAEALARRVLDALPSAPAPFQTEDVRQALEDEAELDARAAVAALAAAGWLVEPVARPAVPDEPLNLAAIRARIYPLLDENCSGEEDDRFRANAVHDVLVLLGEVERLRGRVTPTPPAPAPPASSP